MEYKVSIILPTYNRAHLLSRAIQSVLAQDYLNFELIIVDDGSDDNSADIVGTFGDKRIRYVRHDRNRGASAAWNTGIGLATGDFIAFQDSDDEWLSGKLAQQVCMLQQASARVGVVYTSFVKQIGGVQIADPVRLPKRTSGMIEKYLLVANWIALPTVLLRRACVNSLGIFDERLPALMDWELFIRYSRKFEFLYIPHALVRVNVTPESISADFTSFLKARELILEKYGKIYQQDPALYARQSYILGSEYAKMDDLLRARKYLRSAQAADGRNIKYLLARVTLHIAPFLFIMIDRFRKFWLRR